MRPTPPLSARLGLTFLLAGLACQADPDPLPAPEPVAPQTPEASPGVEEAPAFLAVARGGLGPEAMSTTTVRQALSQMQSSAPADAFDPEQSFYLAVHRRELGKRWFLSAYLKQFFPGAVLGGAASSLGTRVVSFKIQNGKLFVFDVDDRKQTSDSFGQDVIVDAYPIVDAGKVGASHLKDYVLVDPAAGLNQFGVVGDGFGSGYLGLNRFMVELAFSQRFRQLKDGATFEQAFTGYTQNPRANPEGVESNFFRASGVLGLALRRYSEGEGFIPRPLGQVPYFFASVPRLIPNEGDVDELAARWNIRPGMKPIRWLISPLVAQANQNPELQALGIDLVEVVRAGIESWNTAFGFPALKAELADAGDSFADDDKNYFIWDVNPSVGFAFADWRLNPNTGEIRGASVYFNDAFVDGALQSFEEEPVDTEAAAPAAPAGGHLSLAWEPMRHRPLCDLKPSALAQARRKLPLGEGLPATRKERVEKVIASIVAHEIGHTLGLRHNFKGSLVPPTTSVMDYTSDQLRAAGAIPGAYDVAAIRHLYAGAPAPTQLFCTDEHILGDPRCAQFDEGADPLQDYWGPFYQLFTQFYLQTGNVQVGQRLSDLLMDFVVNFVHRAQTPAERMAAWRILVADIGVPVPPARLSMFPSYAPAANHLSRSLFLKAVPDPARPVPRTWNGIPVPLPPLDPAIGTVLVGELRGNLLNLDGFRAFPTRRLAVDQLKLLQTLPAYEVLREARSALQPPAEPPPPAADLALIQDLLARIDRAVTPYFNR